MAVSLPFCLNTGKFRLVDPVVEPTLTTAYGNYQSIFLLAQQIPTSAADRTLDSSRLTKDMS